MKKYVAMASVLCMAVSLAAGCRKEEPPSEGLYGMVCDTAQIKENPFCWSAWTGLLSFTKIHKGLEARYLESRSEEDILPNLEKLADDRCRLIWGIGGMVEKDFVKSAKMNQDTDYVLLDGAPDKPGIPDNIAYVDFRTEEASFLAGYAAGYVTKTGCTGFVGGKETAAVKRFEDGFTQGVAYASEEQGKKIQVKTGYAKNFEDRVYGARVAQDLLDEGCDVLFHAAGISGLGVIEAAAKQDAWAIGADVDQLDEAPDNVLFSVLKRTGEAVRTLTERYYDGEKLGGQTYVYGLSDNGVGLTEKNPNLTKNFPGLYEKILKVKDQIINGKIKVTVTNGVKK